MDFVPGQPRLSCDDVGTMPIYYLRRLSGRDRTAPANRQLARYLAFVAGAINAGGFLAVHQYTSHMSGIVSSMADNLAVGSFHLVLIGASSVLSFLAGAASTSLMVGLARRRALHSEYALPLLAEAIMLVGFAVTGREFEAKGAGSGVIGTILPLCFTMGLQNAIITKISGAVIRTTHMTGIVTDIGIEVGHAIYAAICREPAAKVVEFDQLWLLASLIGLFFSGGIVGALGFRYLGFLFSLPFATVLLIMAVIPLSDDLRGTP